MVLPHRRFRATPKHPDSGDDQENFAAMVTYMDDIVGNLRDTLEKAGIADNTLVMFIGDNGTDHKITSLRNGNSVKGGKALTLQSATHVPFIVWWPGVVAPGTVNDELIYLADVFPTVAEVSGSTEILPTDIDGQSLLSFFVGEKSEQWSRDFLFMHYDPRWSKIVPARYVFDTRWKLYEGGRFFDVLQDPLEENPFDNNNLSAEGKRAFNRLQLRLSRAAGELSGVLSPQAIYRRDRNQRRTLIAVCVLVVASIWFGRRLTRRSAIS